MSWTAERIDNDNHIVQALKMVGFKNIGPLEIELILNVARLVQEKGDKTTLRDISETEECVRGLFEKPVPERPKPKYDS